MFILPLTESHQYQIKRDEIKAALPKKICDPFTHATFQSLQKLSSSVPDSQYGLLYSDVMGRIIFGSSICQHFLTIVQTILRAFIKMQLKPHPNTGKEVVNRSLRIMY